MNARLTTADIPIREVLNDLLIKFKTVEVGNFEIYYKKIIIPAPKDKAEQLQWYGSSDSYIRPFWEAVLPYPLDRATSWPDFSTPLDLHNGREAHFALFGKDVTEGWHVLTPIANAAVEWLRLRRYEIGEMPDSETLIKDFPKRYAEESDSILWYELLLKFGLDERQGCLINGIRRELLQDTCDTGLPDFIVEVIGTTLCEASIKAIKHLLRVADKAIEAEHPSGEVGGEIKTTPGTEWKTKNFEELPSLNDAERNIIKALDKKTLIGEELAIKAGYPYNSNFKSTLSRLRKRAILGNKAPGYFLEPKYNFLLDESD